MPRKPKKQVKVKTKQEKVKLEETGSDEMELLEDMVPGGKIANDTQSADSDQCSEDLDTSEIVLDTKGTLDPKLYMKNKPNFSCKQCTKKFKFKKSFIEHLKIEHSKTPGSVKCDHCTVSCPNETILKEHIKKAHESVFSCPNCHKTFARQFHVYRHLEQKGCDGTKIRQFTCEICQTAFSRKDNLLTHLRNHISKKYTCKLCDYFTKSFNKLVNHDMVVHKGNKHECDVCGKITSSRTAMAKHAEIHGAKKFACEVCGYATFTIEVMRRHVLRHTSDKPYKCSICPSSFIQLAQLRRHLERHLGLTCSVCNKCFKSNAQLIKHVEEHKDVKILKCPKQGCNRKIPILSKEELQKHLDSHANKLFTCEVCQKSFPTEMNLRRHLSTHELERPRRCMYCVTARAYVRGHMLVRHVRLKHPDIFKDHLQHVRDVLGSSDRDSSRVRQSELDSVLNLLDAVSDRILEQNAGSRVLYGGVQEDKSAEEEEQQSLKKESNDSPLLSEAQLASSLGQLLTLLVEEEILKEFGWPDEDVDVVLEKVIEKCGQTPADKNRWSRVQCLRENAKHLFVHVVEDKGIGQMLATHTIDQVVQHILELSSGGGGEDDN